MWCDVVPMDACNILLGRPWQYDRDTIHRGAKKIDTFWKMLVKSLTDERSGTAQRK